MEEKLTLPECPDLVSGLLQPFGNPSKYKDYGYIIGKYKKQSYLINHLFFWGGCLFRARSTAYGSPQARGRIGATVSCLVCNLLLSLTHHWILNPQIEARNLLGY